MNTNKKIVVSGMRPTGRIHLGNYHGVLKNWLILQEKYTCLFFIADIHAFTTNHENNDLNKNINLMINDWLAAGIDPKKSHIFLQSHISETFELNTLLSMITPISWLEHMPTYKSKIKLDHKYKTHGFLGYPILQGADILIFKADYVPIGEDQLPHIELIKKIVKRFNFIHKKNILKEPQALLYKHTKILGLNGKKMSKSENNTILISDNKSIIEKKIKLLTTDSNRTHRHIKGNPYNCSVWKFHLIYTSQIEKIYIKDSCQQAKIGCVECKNILMKKITQENEIIQEKLKFNTKNNISINEIITKGKKYAKSLAKNTIKQIKTDLNLI